MDVLTHSWASNLPSSVPAMGRPGLTTQLTRLSSCRPNIPRTHMGLCYSAQSTVAAAAAPKASVKTVEKPNTEKEQLEFATTSPTGRIEDEEGEEEDEEEKEEEEEEEEAEEFDAQLRSAGFDTTMEMFVPPGMVLKEGEKPSRRLPGSNIFLGPHASNSRVKQAEFVKSSTCTAECPQDKFPEFALVGRSNVGKSSLINALVQRKALAQISKKPGKTQLINHFIINNSWYLVDLPGYGYAKVPAIIRASWDKFTKDFFLQSKTLVCVMLLVDASIPPQPIDIEYAGWLREHKVPFTLVFTKCDRKKKKKNGGRKAEENLKEFLKLLRQSFNEMPPWIMTSCVTNQGKDALLMQIAQLRNFWNS